MIVELKWDAEQQIPKGHPEDQWRYGTADEQSPVPGLAPSGVVDFAAVVETDRTKKESPQHNQHGPVETGKCGGVNQRPGGKNGTATGDEPDLVSIPVWPDGVDDDTAFHVVLANEGQQCANTHVVSVHDGEADQQHADQQPPDEF